MAFNHKKADFWLPNFGFKSSLLGILKDNVHFLLQCPRFSLQRRPLLKLVSSAADVDIMPLSSDELTNVLLDGGHPEFTVPMNRTIIEATLKFI